MTLTGKNYIAGTASAEGQDTFRAINPATGAELDTHFTDATEGEVNRAAQAAAEAFEVYRHTTPAQRHDYLTAIAEEIMALGDALIDRCCAESGLPAGRITGERGRTVNQLKLFAAVAAEGSWVDARIDRAQPEREPVPKPDVRSMLRPLGPVAVFGASNFPLAFSVAGGDTASALAAGCPVVAKAHPSHPGTCELIAGAIHRATERCGLPAGVFSLLQGHTHDSGGWLVNHPAIKAVGFTGSYGGGKALFDAANRRPEPIPVYAEMGSTNPVFLLPGALSESGEEIARGLTQSVNLGVGQFCTTPGLVFLPPETDASAFSDAVAEQFRGVDAAVMLNASIRDAYERGVRELAADGELEALAQGKTSDVGYTGTARVFTTTAERYLSNTRLQEEVFGPSTVLVAQSDREQLLAGARGLHGHLTATLFGTEADLEEYRELVEILEGKVGRLIVNNFPTGVEVCHSMVHGGPFPATTASGTTSVGTRAILRFARPVAYQNFPQSLLPPALQDDNPLGLRRMVDGEWVDA
ncbi:NADP-dependent aldehyde dehydrogenase [Lewinella marina]|uniref:Aldehyde dehydrogenase (NADP(+)) n=1 Tax=Neolewinella marina TaxID=438751 RepID=A0A2G0CDW8_9BACT|nr:aldehyde dehydrogenase (NADP(+)) [Neolewinella marina]NJB87540.1 NADP-dependent aldehyde dehydrogenase [Neolewinella marina]PHK98155.1 aldehyde dehydrogenase (NADP(+)) [Neolewinella marina]